MVLKRQNIQSETVATLASRKYGSYVILHFNFGYNVLLTTGSLLRL